MLTKEGQVRVQVRGRHGNRERLCTFLEAFLKEGLLKCSHLLQGLILRDRISCRGHRLLQLGPQ